MTSRCFYRKQSATPRGKVLGDDVEAFDKQHTLRNTRDKQMTDEFTVAMTKDEIAMIHKALSEHLALLLKEWEHQESIGEKDAAASLFERADEVRMLINRIGAAPLNLR